MSSEYPSLFRSEEMSLVQLYVPTEVAHDTVLEVGQLGRIQFRDLNPSVNPFQRSFVGEIRRIDEMDRRVRFFAEQIKAEQIPVRPLDDSPQLAQGNRGPQVVDELDVKLAEHEARLVQMNQSYETLAKKSIELEEARHVLRETAIFFQQAAGHREEIRTSFEDSDSRPLLHGAGDEEQGGDAGIGGFELEFIAGTIDRARMPTFERILWRVLRGNLYMNYVDLEDVRPAYGASPDAEPIRKSVFIIFAHGQELLQKIHKVADSMGGTVYPIDANPERRAEALRDVSARIEDLNTVLYNTAQTRRAELVKIAEALAAWATIVRKEKSIYATLNLFNYDPRRKTLVAEGWVPTRDITAVQLALRRATENAGTSVPPILHEVKTNAMPPTFHRTNKFTEAFQTIVDAYGIATYREVNPGLYTVITFPFLFAVMFGDIGHGFITACAAAAMCIWEKKLARAKLGEIFETFFFGRYIILLMGLFSIYTGFIYNDIFSKSLSIFSSAYEWPEAESGVVEAHQVSNPYALGLDPAWHGADNALVFTNSYKMKMSIILGVTHMTFAICLNIPNYLYWKKPQNIWAEWLPQILFLHSIFGYLVVTIIIKWATDWSRASTSPPGLLNMLIYMFLSPGSINADEQLFWGQGVLQVVLLLLALVCVPWMLITKPYLAWKEHQRTKAQGYDRIGNVEDVGSRLSSDSIADAEEGNGHSHADEHTTEMGPGASVSEGMTEELHASHEFDLGEEAIHQVIHTIEFCLGAISNTASYLRLWALSLAHAQLSEVLWTMTLEPALSGTGVGGVVFLVIMFAFWFILTLAILCIMEGLSAFLHALRLHWVEANGKHYQAGGYAFTPLKFEEVDPEEIA